MYEDTAHTICMGNLAQSYVIPDVCVFVSVCMCMPWVHLCMCLFLCFHVFMSLCFYIDIKYVLMCVCVCVFRCVHVCLHMFEFVCVCKVYACTYMLCACVIELYKQYLQHFMCYRIYAIASQLSPVDHSSGIEYLEADTFSLYCFQTLTGNYILEVLDARYMQHLLIYGIASTFLV